MTKPLAEIASTLQQQINALECGSRPVIRDAQSIINSLGGSLEVELTSDIQSVQLYITCLTLKRIIEEVSNDKTIG